MVGCSSLGNLFSGGDSEEKSEEKYTGWNSAKFREEAKKKLDVGDYEKAIELYEALESRFPYGQYAAQTQIDIAYAYYKNNDSEAATAAADRFIKTNPRNPNVDYAYFLKGLANYNRGIGFVDRFLPSDPSQRDTSSANDAYKNFEELLSKYPQSRYRNEAKLRMTALRNNIAMHEVQIARYYIKRKAYVAAANRATEVIENYQRAPAVPLALEILQEAYTNLGLTDLAQDTKRVYDLNFPNGTPVQSEGLVTFSHRVWDFIGFDK